MSTKKKKNIRRSKKSLKTRTHKQSLLTKMVAPFLESAHKAFYESHTRSFVVTNNVLAFLTIVSIASLILETVPAFASYDIIFRTIEFVSVFFFSLEYIGRLVAAPNKLKYIFSFFGIIDLLTILPTFLGLTNLTFLKSVRILRILRFLRMLRLAKILRQSRRSFKKEEQKSLYRLNVEIYFIALFAAIVIFGSIAYIVEGYRPEFSSIPISMIWSAKVLLGGVSLYMPETVPGEFVTIGTRFTGMVLFGLLITVVGSGIKRLLFGTTEIEKETKE